MTLTELRQNNCGYFLGANGVNDADLSIVNNLIERIESTRTNKIQTLDSVEYTTEYGSYYPQAMAEFNTYFDGQLCIIQSASCNIDLYKDKLSHSVSGGSFDGGKDESKCVYKGKTKKSFWTWSSCGAGAHQGLYFDAEVSEFVYNERPEALKHLSKQFLTQLYISDAGADTIEQYRFCAFMRGMAWKNEKELNTFLKKYKAIEEEPRAYNKVYWVLNPVEKYCFDRSEFEAINAPEFIKWWNGSDRAQKEVIIGNDLITYVDRSAEHRYTGRAVAI